MSAEHVVGRADEIPLGERRIVTVAGHSIGIFNVGGQFHALHNRCPHHGAPLCEGRIGGTTGSAGGYELHQEREGEILRCAWHGWEFEISSGRMLADPQVRARRYPVRVAENGDLVLSLGRVERDGV